MEIPLIVHITGAKNTGKTTLITRLLPELRRLGVSTAVLKHLGHGILKWDSPGTDTYRFTEAGSRATGIISGNDFAFHDDSGVNATPEDLAGLLYPGYDLLLVEGFKHSPALKVEVLRKGVSTELVSEVSGLLAVYGDCVMGEEGNVSAFTGIERFGDEEVGKLASMLANLVGKHGDRNRSDGDTGTETVGRSGAAGDTDQAGIGSEGVLAYGKDEEPAYVYGSDGALVQQFLFLQVALQN